MNRNNKSDEFCLHIQLIAFFIVVRLNSILSLRDNFGRMQLPFYKYFILMGLSHSGQNIYRIKGHP